MIATERRHCLTVERSLQGARPQNACFLRSNPGSGDVDQDADFQTFEIQTLCWGKLPTKAFRPSEQCNRWRFLKIAIKGRIRKHSDLGGLLLSRGWLKCSAEQPDENQKPPSRGSKFLRLAPRQRRLSWQTECMERHCSLS